MKNTTMKAAAAILSLSLTGCSCFVGSKEMVTVTTNVPDAAIYLNGSRVGRGSANFYARKNKSVQIIATADGYDEARHYIDHHLSATGILDIVGFFIFFIPGVGLFTPGAMELDENNVALDLEPLKQPSPQTN